MKTPDYIVSLCNELVDDKSHIYRCVYCYSLAEAKLAGMQYVSKQKDDFGLFAWYDIYRLTK